MKPSGEETSEEEGDEYRPNMTEADVESEDAIDDEETRYVSQTRPSVRQLSKPGRKDFMLARKSVGKRKSSVDSHERYRV